MYLEACLQPCPQFLAFITSVDELLGVEAMANLKRIASHLATKWRNTYYRTCGYVKSRVAIKLVRSTHRCIWGFRVPAQKISVHRLQLEDGSRINLFRQDSQGISRPSESLTPPQSPSHNWDDGLSRNRELQYITSKQLVYWT